MLFWLGTIKFKFVYSNSVHEEIDSSEISLSDKSHLLGESDRLKTSSIIIILGWLLEKLCCMFSGLTCRF